MTQAVHRRPRMRPAGPAQTQFEVPALPSVDPPAKLQPVQLLIPVLGSLSILVYGVMARAAVLLVTGGIMALASLASPLVLHWSASRAQRSKVLARRERYRLRLQALAAVASEARTRLAQALADPHPAPGEHERWIASSRLWERRLEDDDVLTVRLGTAPLATGFVVARSAAVSLDAEPDADLLAEVEAFVDSVTTLPAAPLRLDLAEAGVVALAGDRTAALGLARAVVLELALTCAPDDLCVAVAVPPGDLAAWSWVTWLPHAAAPGDAGLAERLVATTVEGVQRLVDAVVAARLRLLDDGTWGASREAFPRVLLVVDRFDPFTEIGVSPVLARVLERGPEVGVSVIALVDSDAAAPTPTTAVINLAPDARAVLRHSRTPSPGVAFVPVSADGAYAERLARQLAPKRLVADSLRSARTGSGRLADLLPRGLLTTIRSDADDLGTPPDGAWTVHEPGDLLRVPFAVDADGGALHLDLKESADGGYGPHGLVVGAVGSGKSELLRTLVAGLAATHAPDDVELAFADFKGGLTFNLLQDLPHCSGMITNLADDLSLVDRMKAALAGELERRQQVLRAAGTDVQRIAQYRALRQRRPELPAMPFLVVVVDEFGELLEARPDVLDVLLSIGRTGRSLGVHLILASQRLEAGRVRGLDSYLGYRICLRTFTAEDSVAVLGSRAAADLPALPGHGYLRTANGLVRFLAATVSGHRHGPRDRRGVRRLALADGLPRPRDASTGEARGDSDLAVLVQRAGAAGPGAARPPLWLPPLPAPGDPRPLLVGDRRLDVTLPPPEHGLPVPVGLVDLPRLRRQEQLRLDPGALDGHALVVGAPQSGKSTLLAAYAVQAARLHPPSMLQFHVVDLGGGGLAPLAGLPNVAAYADGQDVDGLRRVLLELQRIVDSRPQQLRRLGASGIAAWRGLVASGAAPGPAHTVLLLDQLASFRERFPDFDLVLGRLVAEGPSAGVHVVMTSTRWAELPPKRLEQVSTRIELRLNDPMESQHGRSRAGAVPAGVPGRGLVGDGLLLQIASPAPPDAAIGVEGTAALQGAGGSGGAAGSGGLAVAVRHAARHAQERWPGVVAAPVRRLADLTPAVWASARRSAMTASEPSGRERLLVGVDEADFAPVTADTRGTMLLAYGDPGSGRTRFLARLLAEAASWPDDARPQVYLLDYLGGLLDACAALAAAGGADVVVAAAYEPQETPDVLTALTGELMRRQAAAAAVRRAAAADPGATGARPPIWLVVDDYELVHAAARPGLVSDLANLVPYAARLGLSVLVAQAANGSGARVDPLIRRILEGAPWHAQFSVESKHELLLRGTRGALLPPGQVLLARPGQGDSLLAVLPPRSPSPAVPADGDQAVTIPASADRTYIRLVS